MNPSQYEVLHAIEPQVRAVESSAIIAHRKLCGLLEKTLSSEMVPTVEVEAARMALDLARSHATAMSDRLDEMFLNSKAIETTKEPDRPLEAAFEQYQAAERAFALMIDDDNPSRTPEEARLYETRYQAAHDAADLAFRAFVDFPCRNLETRKRHAKHLLNIYENGRAIVELEDMNRLLKAIAS